MYTHIYIERYIYAHTHVHIHTSVLIFFHQYMYIYTYICIYIYTYIHIYVFYLGRQFSDVQLFRYANFLCANFLASRQRERERKRAREILGRQLFFAVDKSICQCFSCQLVWWCLYSIGKKNVGTYSSFYGDDSMCQWSRTHTHFLLC